MKKILIATVIAIISMSATAQHVCPAVSEGMTRAEFRKQMFEQKLIYFEEQMGLSETEKATFETLYREYTEKVREIKKAQRNARHALKETPTESDYKNYVEVSKTAETALAKERVTLIEELEKIITAEKIYKFHLAEKEFKNLLIKDIGKMKIKNKK